MNLIPLIILTLSFSLYSKSLKYLGDHFKDKETPWSAELQGLCHDERFFYITQRDFIWKIPRTHRIESTHSADKSLLAKVGIPHELKILGANHMGDCDVARDQIFIPLEGTQPLRLLILNTHDLSVIGAPEITTGQGHAPWVTIDSKDGSILVGTFNLTKRNVIYRLTYNEARNKLNLIEEIKLTDSSGNPISIKRIQGVEISQDHQMIWVVSDHKKGGLYGFHSQTYHYVMKKVIDFSPGFPIYGELEGIDILEDHESFEAYSGNILIPVLNNNLIKKDFATLKAYQFQN